MHLTLLNHGVKRCDQFYLYTCTDIIAHVSGKNIWPKNENHAKLGRGVHIFFVIISDCYYQTFIPEGETIDQAVSKLNFEILFLSFSHLHNLLLRMSQYLSKIIKYRSWNQCNKLISL